MRIDLETEELEALLWALGMGFESWRGFGKQTESAMAVVSKLVARLMEVRRLEKNLRRVDGAATTP